MTAPEATSPRPYLIRALYEWCTDNGFTPHIAVRVDRNVQVPREFVRDGEIVLNVSYDATSGLQMGNDFISFTADRKSTRLNSSHLVISYAVFCLKKKNIRYISSSYSRHTL